MDEEDSDPQIIVKSQTLTTSEIDLFVEGNTTRKIEAMVKKRLRPRKKTVGSLPVMSDPEQSSSSDETFVGRPSASANTPDLTTSRTLIGLPDNTSTPTSASRFAYNAGRKRELSFTPEWKWTRSSTRCGRR